jgi:hypothetical protein
MSLESCRHGFCCGWHPGGQTREDRLPIATGALERRSRGGVAQKGRGICAEAANDAAKNGFDVTDRGKAAARPPQVWCKGWSDGDDDS